MNWVYSLLGGRKMTVYLSLWVPVIIAFLKASEATWPQFAGPAAWILGVLALAGFGTNAGIAYEDAAKKKANAMVEAATADMEAARAHAEAAAIQAAPVPGGGV